jgi:hypothetical protein
MGYDTRNEIKYDNLKNIVVSLPAKMVNKLVQCNNDS